MNMKVVKFKMIWYNGSSFKLLNSCSFIVG